MTDRLRRLDPLSPLVAFPAVWTLGALLAQIHVLDFQGGWPTIAWIVVVAVPVAFVAGGALGKAAASCLSRPARARPIVAGPTTRSRRLLLGFVAVGWAEQIHQFLVAGVVPLLSSSIDAARTSLPGGPTIVLTNALAIAAIVALTLPSRLLARSAVPEIAIAAGALMGYVVAGGRGTVLMPLAVALLARCLVWGRPPARVLLAGATVGTGFFSALFYLRVAQGTVEPFDAELFGHVIPNTSPALVPLLPVYFALAMNFEALAAIVATFPAEIPFAYGSYDALGLDIIFTGARPLGTVSAELTPPWLTSTLAGPLWADGGLVLVVIGLIVLGAATCACHSVARRSRELRHALLFSYVLYLTLFCVYQNVWTQQIDWVFVAPCLLLVGAYVTNPADPPGVAGRLRMTGMRQISPRRGLLTASIVALAVLVAAVVVAVSNIGVDKVNRTGDHTQKGALPIGGRLALPITGLRGDTKLVTDGDIPTDNEPLRTIGTSADKLVIDRFSRVGERRVTRLHRLVDVGRTPSGTVFDFSHWTRDDDGVLFMLRDLGRTIDIRVIAPTAPIRTVMRRRVPIERVETGMVRDFAVARWSGSRPDLFVVERGSALSRVRVIVFSGESGFSQRLVDVRAPLRGIPRGNWDVDVGDVDGQRPDVLLVRRGTSKHAPEVHILDGDNRFQSFAMQRTTKLPKGNRPTDRFVFGSSLGYPALYALDLRKADDPTLTNLLLTR